MQDDPPAPLPPGPADRPELPAAALFKLGLEETVPQARRGVSWQPPPVEDLQAALPGYEVLGFLARGGMGAVYKGTQKALARPVAIKVLPPEVEQNDPDFAERFKREAQAMARLSHPAIVNVFDAGETSGGLLYFVMEFIEGSDVAQLLALEARLQPARALKIAIDVLDALAFAHECGVVHRDIKPSNVMLDMRGRVKVADFGLAKVITQDSAGFTRSDVALGTADFIAPEAMIPGMKVDGRADVYAVGVMLYQMLTGHIPRGSFDPPSGEVPQLDPRLDAIVLKAMKTDREKRYASAAEMKTALEGAGLKPAPPHMASAGTESLPASGPVKRRPTKALLVAVSALGIAAGAFFIWNQKKPAPGPELMKRAAVMQAPLNASPPSNAAVPRPSSLPASIEARAIKLWDTEAALHPDNNGVRWEKEAMRLDKRGMSPPKLVAVRDIILRASVLSNPDARGVKLHLRNPPGRAAGNVAYALTFEASEGSVRLGVHDDKGSSVLGKWDIHRTYGPDEWIKLEFRAIGDVFTLIADGQVLGTVRDSTLSQPGGFELDADSRGYFRDISYIPLDGLPEAEALKLAGLADAREDSTTFAGHRYLVVKEQMAWSEAKAKAEAMGGHLATLTSKEECAAVYDLCRKVLPCEAPAPGRPIPPHQAWLGASRDKDSTWKWVTGERFDYTDWNPAHSEDKHAPYGLTVMTLQQPGEDVRAWNGVVTRMQEIPHIAGFVVEWDNDGKPGMLKATGTTSFPGRPVLASSGTGLTFNGHRYLLVAGNTSWNAAKARAAAMGGHLVVINNQEENDWIRRTLIDPLEEGKMLWIGATNSEGDGQWRWVNGDPFSFTGWAADIVAGKRFNEPHSCSGFCRNLSQGVGWSLWGPDDPNVKRNTGFIVEWDNDGRFEK